MGIAGNGAIDPRPSLPPRTGLIASATVLESAVLATPSDATPETRWQLGYSWAPEACDANGTADPCSNVTPKDADDPPGSLLADPFVVFASDKCRATPAPSRDRIGRARRRLIAGTSKLVAHELWTGDQAQASSFPNLYLASPAANTLTNGAVSALDAMVCLEDALATCSDGTTMIHASPGLMTHWRSLQLVERFGNIFRTANDTIVVADAGYDGSAPTGAPATSGSVWAYGTDLVTVRLSDISVLPSDDPEDYAAMTLTPAADNSFTFIAERLASAVFDACCHVAVEVNIALCADPANS